MKTISKREGKNYEIEVKGDLHQYPDGSVHTVKEGKAVWGEGGGSAAGYSVEETKTTVFDGNATTADDGHGKYVVQLPIKITAPTICVIFDSVEYIVERTNLGDNRFGYGDIDIDHEEPDFTNIPFAIMSSDHFDHSSFVTESAGTHSVKIETLEQSVETTPDFEAAVASVSNVYIVNISMGDRVGLAFDKTASEVFNAMQRTGVICVFSSPGSMSVHNLSAASRSPGSDPEYVFTIDAEYPIGGDTGDIEFEATNGDDYPSTNESK